MMNVTVRLTAAQTDVAQFRIIDQYARADGTHMGDHATLSGRTLTIDAADARRAAGWLRDDAGPDGLDMPAGERLATRNLAAKLATASGT